jgi:hydroxypyruvate isomerase
VNRREFTRKTAVAAATVAAASLASVVRSAPARAVPGDVPFKLSVMLWTVDRKLPFEQRLEKVAAAGYTAVELVREYTDWTKDDFVAARRKKQELGFEFDAVAGVWHALADPADREPFLKSVREFILVMNDLECRRLILQTGNKVAGLSYDQMRANCVETLRRAGDVAAKENIELLIENIDPEENPKYFLTSSADGFEIIRAVGNPHVKFLYDFFHEQIAEGNLISKLVKNIDLVGLIHVADVPGRHEPGSGEINYANIFRKLGELRYNRYVAMEFVPTGDTEQSLRSAREMAIQFGRA